MGLPPTAGNNESSEQLSKPETQSGFFTMKRFSDELDPRLVYLPLLVCCFATGLTDGTLYNGASSMHLRSIIIRSIRVYEDVTR
jgi:hypothetical protein